MPGDYNKNGVVDAGDYDLWRKGDLAADGTGPSGVPDGVVNGLDYNFWRARFGNTSGSGLTLSTIPELYILPIGICFCRFRRQSSNHLASKGIRMNINQATNGEIGTD